ncbi:hypothetical protein EC912_10195 [Luteibacter rhizovicinus]|uniref:CAAX prenyl protease 2/Lysostaphin resistance protein A-like domain-containing protein n=1 Tax=Luteibacter rhizovicinus TaxID=242606 RepID=A0A4R3YWX1_9GAMM|nr:CPBP family intramembrane glutamic endopeptidase [Luteibacter rhizovicinus]TCV97100.1 hypothetical protein EC912_10195 [Luteibacter rhizovicinus]
MTHDSTPLILPATASSPLAPPPLRPATGLLGAAAVIVFYFLMQLVFGQIFAAVARMLLGLNLDDAHAVGQAVRAPDILLGMVVCTLLAASAVTLGLIVWRWRPWLTSGASAGLGFNRPELRFLAMGLLAGIVLPFVGGALTQFLAGKHEVTQAVSELADGASVGMRVLLLPIVVMVGPLVEEALFRGALLSSLRGRFSVATSIAASALVFGAVHLPDLDWAWYAVPNLTLIGVACAWLRVRTGSIWPSFAAHAMNNALASVAWFVAAN